MTGNDQPLPKILGYDIQPNPKPVFKERTVDILFPDGVTRTWSMVDAPDIAVIVALDNQQNVYLKSEWRQAHNRVLLELPSGRVETGEDPASTAARELKEEVGLTSAQLIKLAALPLWNHCSLQAHIYLALNCTVGQNQLDEGEFLTLRPTPLASAITTATADGTNAQTLLALLLAQQYLTSK